MLIGEYLESSSLRSGSIPWRYTSLALGGRDGSLVWGTSSWPKLRE